MKKSPIILIVLDGFGFRKEMYYNGVLNSKMPNYFKYWNTYPHTKLHASGPLVGLPKGQIGSSEVGHMTIGAGRLIKQPIVRISEDIENDLFFKHSKLMDGLKFVKKSKGNIHLMGLLGCGGVHSLDKHLYALLDFYDKYGKEIDGQIFIHNFLDGRDTPQKSCLTYLKQLETKIKTLKHRDKFVISTICGRYYAMDRDKRWERTELAYNMLVFGNANKFKSYEEAIKSSYEQQITDEFVKPVILQLKPIRNNDLCVFYNFRSDRVTQIMKAFGQSFDKTDNPFVPYTLTKFNEFETKKLNNVKFQTLTDYSPNFRKVDVLYPTIYPKNTLGKVLENHNLKQLRIAESEKFPHVTYFFSGLQHKEFKDETRIKIDSPKVSTYDLQPEMSAKEVTRQVIAQIDAKKYDFIMLNFANSDMVGHTGDYEAVLEAMQTVDESLGQIKAEIDKHNGLMIITSDHGNCETMRDEKDNPHTKHTYNLVPFVLCNKKYKISQNIEKLSLFNIAPTILDIMNIKKPKEMNVNSLILNNILTGHQN